GLFARGRQMLRCDGMFFFLPLLKPVQGPKPFLLRRFLLKQRSVLCHTSVQLRIRDPILEAIV
ncbi:MAG: hypothetical protein ABG776_21085, partial [Cyanobacteria bacterium J06555_13]